MQFIALTRRALLAAGLLAAALTARAGDAPELERFLTQTRSARADFSQVVLDANRQTVQRASGTMAFERPGRFRWEYRQPYEQLIVGDGQKLWFFDKDLNQVTVKPLDEAVGASPAALLAGANDFSRLFDVRRLERRPGADAGPDADGLRWVRATPKARESSFEEVLLGFAGDRLTRMELKDAFGQTTLIRFSDLTLNPALDASQFRFAPPKGADVIQ